MTKIKSTKSKMQLPYCFRKKPICNVRIKKTFTDNQELFCQLESNKVLQTQETFKRTSVDKKCWKMAIY